MMVALLLYAYARLTRSSRQIERGCEEDVALWVLAVQQRPDHATITKFVVPQPPRRPNSSPQSHPSATAHAQTYATASGESGSRAFEQK
jgi:Transposase domain (DUF772)